MTSGSRNLIIMGIAATAVAIATTGVSLAIYHNSGDIYLDRSRPGFLPDESEVEESDEAEDYVFSSSGEMTKEVIDEYLEHLNIEIEELNNFTQPFNPASLSDESLNIPAATE